MPGRLRGLPRTDSGLFSLVGEAFSTQAASRHHPTFFSALSDSGIGISPAARTVFDSTVADDVNLTLSCQRLSAVLLVRPRFCSQVSSPSLSDLYVSFGSIDFGELDARTLRSRCS